jgi:hypothetical protein
MEQGVAMLDCTSFTFLDRIAEEVRMVLEITQVSAVPRGLIR